jgi:hypothetical protein
MALILNLKSLLLVLIIFNLLLINLINAQAISNNTNLSNSNQNITEKSNISGETTDLKTISNIINLLTSVGAAFGAAYLTNRFTTNREKQKEIKFNKSIRMLIHDELESYSDFIDKLDKASEDGNRPGDWEKYIKLKRIEKMPQKYTQMTIETRAKVFEKFEDLKKVEAAYFDFQSFINDLQAVDRRSTHEGKTGFNIKDIEKVKDSISSALKFSE